jgi:Ala-tRNA(Pro) deacylase
MEVFADQTLSRDEEIAFSAGTHSELVKVPFADFARLVQPKMVKIA